MSYSSDILPILESVNKISDEKEQILNDDVGTLLLRAQKASLTPLYELPLKEARAEFDRRSGVLELESEDVLKTSDILIGDGEEKIPARLYRGHGCRHEALVIFVHGGGWVLGNVESYDRLCRRFANRIRLPVVSIEYRLAPEHPFPTALNDVTTAILARSDLAQLTGVGTEKWAIMGDSAGGNLVSAALLELPPYNHPDLQVLIYPATDFSYNTGSRLTYGQGYLLDSSLMAWFSKLYLGELDPSNPRASILAHRSLAKSPSTLLVTAGLDPLSDEGVAYGCKLQKAGVGVDHLHCADLLHGFLSMPLALPKAVMVTQQISDYVRKILQNNIV